MIENITKTQNGYRASIDGVEWSIPEAPGNRHWQMVQDAIAVGATVTLEVPLAAPVPNLSFAQMLIGLVSEGWITVDEGRAWRDRVSLPTAVVAVISALPEEQQFAAETKALAASVVIRSDPLVSSMAIAAGRTEEEIDNFFRTYSQV